MAIALLVIALAFTAVAIAVTRSPATTQATTTSPEPSVAVTSSPSATTRATAASSGSTALPNAPSPTPRGQFVNAKYGYAVTLPDPYHPSERLTREFSGSHPAARDVFTVLSPAEEDFASQGADCEVQCMANNGAAVILIFTDAGSMTPRQWFDAGNTPGSPGTLTDVTLGGRAALKIQPSGKYEVMYVVADGKGRMFHLAYELFHIAPAPEGASREKLDQLILSFRFV